MEELPAAAWMSPSRRRRRRRHLNWSTLRGMKKTSDWLTRHHWSFLVGCVAQKYARELKVKIDRFRLLTRC